MIGKTILGIVAIAIVYTILRANGFQAEELLGHIGQFLEYAADGLMQLWTWLTGFFDNGSQQS